MNVLHIAGAFARHPLYAQLIRSVRDLGHKQTVFAPVRSAEEMARQPIDEPGRIEYRFRRILRPLHRVLFRTKIDTIFGELISCLDPAQFDIVHAHTLYSDGAAALQLKLRFGTPYLVAVRNTDLNIFMRFRPDLRWLMRSVLENASHIVFISPSYREQMLSRLSDHLREQAEQKSCVLGNGLDSFWFELPDPERQETSDCCRLLYVGDFSKNKNVEGLLRAVESLSKDSPFELTLAGGGGNRDKQIRDMLSRGTYPFAKFLGRIDDRSYLRDLYRSYDVFVMPSFKETFGVVYLEALSQGLPILHSIGQGVDGFFDDSRVSEAVDPGSVADIARGIRELSQRRDEVRDSCINEVRPFSWGRIASQYDQLYRSTGNCASPPPNY